jgi:hypothetical protein
LTKRLINKANEKVINTLENETPEEHEKRLKIIKEISRFHNSILMLDDMRELKKVKENARSSD